MQHEDQHIEAIARTIQSKNQVSAAIFDDKVKNMGHVTVEKGLIKVALDYVPSMVSEAATRDFLIEAISLSLRACFDKNSATFDPHHPS